MALLGRSFSLIPANGGVLDSLPSECLCRLLSIPLEIRRKIYELCAVNYLSEQGNNRIQLSQLRPPEVARILLSLRVQPNNTAWQHLHHRQLIDRFSLQYPDLRRVRIGDYPSLLLACKQIFSEARDIIYANASFDFIDANNPPDISMFLQHVFTPDIVRRIVEMIDMPKECWIRAVGNFKPFLLRSISVILHGCTPPSRPGHRQRTARELACVVTDLKGALRHALNVSYVQLHFDFASDSTEEEIDFNKDGLDSKIDTEGFLEEFLMGLPSLKCLTITGCGAKHVFFQAGVNKFLQRGVRCVDS